MINESFDDDIPDEDDLIVTPADEPGSVVEDSEVVTERPAGQFSRNLNGREFWFKQPIPGQFTAFKRYRDTLARRYEALSVRARKNPSAESLEALQELLEKIDLSTLEFFESLLADESDIDFIAMEMIGGRVTAQDVHNVMFFDNSGPEDDEEPAPKVKPVRKQPASKKAANAKRTQRK